MKHYLALPLAFTSLSVLAQPTLVTELSPGDHWLKTSYISDDTDGTVEGKNVDYYEKESFGSDSARVVYIGALDGSGANTPIISFSLEHEDSDDSYTTYSLSAGTFLTKPEDKAVLVSGTYYGSSDQDEQRSSFELGLDFQTSGIGSSVYNELSVTAEWVTKNGNESGAHSIGAVNTTKFRLAPSLHAVTGLGLILRTDRDDTNDLDQEYTTSYSPALVLAALLSFDISSQLTLQAGVGRGAASGTATYNSTNNEYDIDTDTTLYTFNLIARL